MCTKVCVSDAEYLSAGSHHPPNMNVSSDTFVLLFPLFPSGLIAITQIHVDWTGKLSLRGRTYHDRSSAEIGRT